MPNPDLPKQPPTQEQVRPAEHEPKNDMGDLALFSEFRIAELKKAAETSSSESFKQKLLNETLPKTQEANEIFTSLFKDQGIRSLDDALTSIDQSIKEYSELLNSDISDDDFDRYKKEQEGYEEARRLLIQNRDTDLFAHPDFDKWNKERNARRREKNLKKQQEEETIRQAQTAQQIEGVYKQIGVESPNEREKSREQAIQRILEDGGINVSASLQEKITQDQLYQSQTGSGYKEVLDPRFSRAKGEIGKGVGTVTRILDDNGINEAVIFEQIQEPIIEQVTVPGKSKWGGLKKEPDRTEYRQTGRFKTHADFVRGGKAETPVRVVYMAKDVETEKDNRDKYGWSDYSGRQGNQMVLEIFVPESTAQEIKRLIDSDPSFIRQMAGRIMKEKILKNPNDWRAEDDPKKGSIRPPYERWGTKPEGAQIYVQTEDMSPEFHKEAIRKIKK